MKLGAAPTGPAGTGKTETVKDLAKTLGRLCITTNCSEALRFDDVSTVLRGLCGVGAWGCFDEFNRISAGVLSVVAQLLQRISTSRKLGLQVIEIADDSQSADARIQAALLERLQESGVLTAAQVAQASKPSKSKGRASKKHGELSLPALRLSDSFGMFATMNPASKDYGGRSQLPDSLTVLLRPVSMMVPDRLAILRVQLCAAGFNDYQNLA